MKIVQFKRLGYNYNRRITIGLHWPISILWYRTLPELIVRLPIYIVDQPNVGWHQVGNKWPWKVIWFPKEF